MPLGLNQGHRSAALLIAIVASSAFFRWGQCGRSLPILSLGIVVHLGRRWARNIERDALVMPLLWSGFSLPLLLKMGLNARVWHYGFVLAMPATICVVYYLTWFLPKALSRFGVNVPLFRGTMLAFIGVGLLSLSVLSNRFYKVKTYPIGRGGDTIYTYDQKVDSRGPFLNDVISWLGTHSLPGSTLSVFPEGLMVNYQVRRPISARRHNITLMADGGIAEVDLVADFDRSPPDHIVVIHRDSREFGVRFWGQGYDYGAQMMEWIKKRYEPAYLAGAEPMKDERFGIRIWKRVR